MLCLFPRKVFSSRFGRLFRCSKDISNRCVSSPSLLLAAPIPVPFENRGNYIFLPIGSRQDAQEFLRYLLDRLHNELGSNDDEIITSLFRGVLWNQVTCLRCSRVSSKEDPFLDMSLTIPERFVARRNKLEQALNPCTIYDCLQAFTELEMLADSERYRCDHCKDMERIAKKFLIKRLPEVLCLHIKRFRYSRSARAKVDTYVQFPLVGLDMAPFSRLAPPRCVRWFA